MVAAQKFNEKAGAPAGPLSGVVSSGTLWRFLRLDGVNASVDVVDYPIENARKIFGILTHVVLGPA